MIEALLFDLFFSLIGWTFFVILIVALAIGGFLKKLFGIRSSEQNSQESSRASILVADDSVIIQKVIELTFMDEGPRVVFTSDGQSAIDWLQHEAFDLIIADVHLPENSGYEVCSFAKEHYPTVPVILLAGAFEAFDEKQYEACGADEFLEKPFDSETLLNMATRLLQPQEHGNDEQTELAENDRPLGLPA